MMYAGRVLAALALVAVSVGAMPNHLKAVVVDADPAPAIPGVSASFGPYSASAGVGAGGGLHAAADSPYGAAAAGLGAAGAGPGAGAEAGGGAAAPPPPKPAKPAHAGPSGTFFDNIFNIPISILQAVNDHLNNQPVVKPAYAHHRRRWHGHQQPDKTATAEKVAGPAPAEATPAPAPEHAAEAAAPALQSGPPPPPSVGVQKNYDAVFAIPIAALKSVNQLLNGGFTGQYTGSHHPSSPGSTGSSSHPQ